MEKLLVIKIGGNVIDDGNRLLQFVKTFAAIDQPKILVHGGGKLATHLAELLNMPQQIVNGRRITDAETLRIAIMVYGGYVNKRLAALLQGSGCNAVGVSGADGNLIRAHKRVQADIDYGFVGDIDKVNSKTITSLLQNHLVPVIAPLTHDGNGQLLNTNADTIASAIAVAMSKSYSVRLVYCFEKKGVLNDGSQNGSVIPVIDKHIHAQLKTSGILTDGILPKIENAFAAVDAGVSEVLIGDAADLLQNVSVNPSGTIIRN